MKIEEILLWVLSLFDRQSGDCSALTGSLDHPE